MVDIKELSCDRGTEGFLEPSEIIRQRIIKTRAIQAKRFSNEPIYTNAEMTNKHIKKYCRLLPEVSQFLVKAGINFSLSARSYYKIIRIARSIADLESSEDITVSHIAEALQYRPRSGERV